MKNILLKLLIVFICQNLWGNWAEETLNKMSLEEKVGQLFIIPICPLGDERHVEELKRIIKTYSIGGVLPKMGKAEDQIRLINQLQKWSTYPLLVVQDAESGLSMRLTDTIKFPKQLTLGAIPSDPLLFAMGEIIARECRRVGAHVNFAPVVDINTNPKNPIIHMRSFGDQVEAVTRRALSLAKGMQKGGVIPCLKHFPGHGDTLIDSHRDLPLVPYDLNRLETVELYPFKKIIQEGVEAIMMAHLHVPALDPKYPSSLSASTIHYLREQLHFDGLIFTDALNMQALSKNYSYEEIALLAFKAGNNFLLYGDHMSEKVDEILKVIIPRATLALKKAAQEQIISLDDLNARVLKILQLKERLKLDQDQTISLENLNQDLHSQEAIDLKKALFSQAVTIFDDQHLIPLNGGEKMAFVQIGQGERLSGILPLLTQEISLASFTLFPNDTQKELIKELKEYPTILIALYDIQPDPHHHFGISQEVKEFVSELQKSSRVILTLFGSPYSIAGFEKPSALLMAYEDDPDAEEAIAKILLGHFSAEGKLPITP